MGGGLLGQELALNPKCLVISLFVVGVYFFPHPRGWQHQAVMGFLLATSVYILIAWYDFLFHCDNHLQPTLFGWMTQGLKPPEYRQAYSRLTPQTQYVVRAFDIAVLFIVFVTFLYPFFTGQKFKSK